MRYLNSHHLRLAADAKGYLCHLLAVKEGYTSLEVIASIMHREILYMRDLLFPCNIPFLSDHHLHNPAFGIIHSTLKHFLDTANLRNTSTKSTTQIRLTLKHPFKMCTHHMYKYRCGHLSGEIFLQRCFLEGTEWCSQWEMEYQSSEYCQGCWNLIQQSEGRMRERLQKAREALSEQDCSDDRGGEAMDESRK